MSEFVELKTADLEGTALDWAVARVEGVTYNPYYLSCGGYRDGSDLWSNWFISNFRPSTCWSDGGPLVQKYHMDFCCEHPETIGAALCDENGMYVDERMIFGSTHLEAACRALVHNKFGETVSVPSGLLQ